MPGHAVGSVVALRGFLVGFFAGLQDDGGVAFSQEEEADYGVEATDYGQDPEDPSPSEILNHDAAKERAKGGSQQRSEQVPAEDAGSLARMEHVTDGASPVRDAHAPEEAADRPHGDQGFHVRAQSGRDLEQGEDGKTGQVQLSPPKRFRERSQDQRADAEEDDEAGGGSHDSSSIRV